MKGKFAAESDRLYKLIWSRFVATQMKNSISDSTTIEVGAGKYTLKVSGQIMKFDGWRKLFKNSNQEEDLVKLPEVKRNEVLKLVKVWDEKKTTLPPARFNEASLIKTLEKLGIGRPSTYAPIISTIQSRAYVEKKDSKFFSTPVGAAVTKFLKGNFKDIMEYDFTAGMEDDLDKVADGKRKWQEMMQEFFSPFEKKLEEVEKKAKRVKIETESLHKKCPKCKEGELVIRIGRFGKFVSCSKFPECDFTDKYEERIGMNCPECKEGKVIIKRTKRGRQFYGCNRYPECKFASWKKPGETPKEGS